MTAHKEMRIGCTSELEEVVVVGEVAYTRSRDAVSVVPRAGGKAAQFAGHRVTVYRKQRDGRWLLSRDVHTLSAVGSRPYRPKLLGARSFMFWKKEPPKSPPPLPPQVTPPQVTPPPLPAAPPAREAMRLGAGMPGKFEGPENDLERALVAFRQRQMEATRFLELLFNSQVFVVPRKEDLVEVGGQLGLAKDPHLFSITYPEYVALAIYTSPSRAKPTTEHYPEFRFAVQVHGGEFLANLSGHCGLVVNPYWDINLEWNADQMDRIKAMMRRNPD